jgi:MoxR-like ATPase
MSSNSIKETEQILLNGSYIADTALTTALHLALALNRPLFLEGEAGVGKTEIAKVLAASLNRNLIRLQCYEGLDVNSAVFEWNYSRQMLGNKAFRGYEKFRSKNFSTRSIHV